MAPPTKKAQAAARGQARGKAKAKRQADHVQLDAKRKEMDKNKVHTVPSYTCRLMLKETLQIADSVKRYSFLLGQTELFKHFVDIKVQLKYPFSR